MLLQHTLSPNAQDVPPAPRRRVSPLWQGDHMSSSDLPDSVFTAFQPVSAALTDLVRSIQINPLQDAAAAVGQILQQQLADINASIAAVQPAALALASVNADIDQALQAVSRTAAQQMQDALSSIDMTGLARLLQDAQAVQLTDAQWVSASRVLDDAYRSAEAGTADDVPDDLVAGLADTAQTFASSHEGLGFLTPERQRQLFAYFCGLLLLAALMQASFTSETADAVIEKTIAYSPAFVLAVAAAGKAWDKYVRRPEDEEAPAAEDGIEDGTGGRD